MKTHIEIIWDDDLINSPSYIQDVKDYLSSIVNEIKHQVFSKSGTNHIADNIKDAMYRMPDFFDVELKVNTDDQNKTNEEEDENKKARKMELDNLFSDFSETFDNMLDTLEEENKESILHQETERQDGDTSGTVTRKIHTLDVPLKLNSNMKSNIKFDRDVKIGGTVNFKLKAMDPNDMIKGDYGPQDIYGVIQESPFDPAIPIFNKFSERLNRAMGGTKPVIDLRSIKDHRKDFINSMSEQELSIFNEVSKNCIRTYDTITMANEAEQYEALDPLTDPLILRLKENHADTTEFISKVRRKTKSG